MWSRENFCPGPREIKETRENLDFLDPWVFPGLMDEKGELVRHKA